MIKQVPIANILAATELIAEYAEECSIPSIGEIDPQADIYAALEDSGVLRSFAAFVDGKMVGFANVLTPVLPHYGKRVATIESLFVAKDSRGSGIGRHLMVYAEHFAEQVGCVGILYSSPTGGELENLLESRAEYQRTNSVFYRRLA
jgi:GNAT superfamily N-acetyltransferase